MSIKSDLTTLKNLILFRETAKNRNISLAANKIGMEQSNLSTAIKDLERELNLKLFNRSNGGVVVTDAGLSIFQQTLKIEGVLHVIKNFSQVKHQISGNIRLWTTDGLGAWCLSNHLSEFYSAYPDVSLDIQCADPEDMPDMANREADVAVIYKEPHYANAVIISKHIMKFTLFASREYVLKYGEPRSMDDLINNHRICDRVNFKDVWSEWDYVIRNAKHVVNTTNSSNVFVQLTKAGVGISLQPTKIATMDPDLIPMNINFELEHPFWIATHADVKDIPKVRTLINYIVKTSEDF